MYPEEINYTEEQVQYEKNAEDDIKKHFITYKEEVYCSPFVKLKLSWKYEQRREPKFPLVYLN